jgi:hypothetical protein
MIIATISTAAALTFGMLGGPGAATVTATLPSPSTAAHVVLAGDNSYPDYCRWYDRDRHDWRCERHGDNDHHHDNDHHDNDHHDNDHHGDRSHGEGHDGGHDGGRR